VDYSEFIHRCRALNEQGKSDLHRGLIGRGLTYQAMFELDMAMKDMNEANQITDDSNPYYLCCRAGVYAAKHEPEKAMQDLETASDMDCDQDVEALIQRAIVLAELGRHNAAIEDLHKANKLGRKPSEQADISYRLGLNTYALNSKEEAFQWFGRATNFLSFHAQAHYRLGMMQAEKGQYKDALKTLNRAHELSPEDGDILLERATVNQQLDKPDEAAQDRKHGMQLNSSPVAITTKLAARIKKLRDESHRNGSSARNHLEIALAYDGLINQKKNIRARTEYYREAVNEYRAAIETDTKYLYPQAYALLALCHQKLNDLNEAHEIHLDFYNGSEYHWKTYLLEVKDKMELGKLEPHLDEAAVSKLIHMELNRRKKDIDEDTFRKDAKDKSKNQLIFYRRLRVDLTNVLAAVAILNLDNESIINNAEDTLNR
jgi:tetratricopeptide (TPR) repeat protein